MAKTRKETTAPVRKVQAESRPRDKGKPKSAASETAAEPKPIDQREPEAAVPEPPAKPRPTETTVPQVPAPEPPAEPKPLEMPRGAMLVMRVSGGLRFTTQEMVIYPDGRVTAGAGDTAKESYNRAQRSMADAHVVRLRRMLDTSGFFDPAPAKGEQSPDGYAYEILARVGSKHNHIEVFTGTMPPGIQSLVDFLMKWLPAADTA